MLEQNNFLLLALSFACKFRLKGMIQQPQPLPQEIQVVTLVPVEHAVPLMERAIITSDPIFDHTNGAQVI